MTRLLLTLILLGACLSGCSQTPEERDASRQFALQGECVHRHGSPIVQDGKFIRCDYPWSIHIGKNKQ